MAGEPVGRTLGDNPAELTAAGGNGIPGAAVVVVEPAGAFITGDEDARPASVGVPKFTGEGRPSMGVVAVRFKRSACA